MKSIITTIAIMAAFAVVAGGQSPTSQSTPTPSPTPVPTETRTIVGPGLQVVQPSTDYVRPSAEKRAKRFAGSVVGPFALGRVVAGAGISTWRNTPEEWGDKWEGFGRRVASNFGKNAIKQTTVYALDEAFKLDSHYYRSKKKDAGSKVRNALLSTVTARDRNGKRVFGFPRLAGTYGSSIIAYEAWYPSRYDWKDGVKSGTISLGFNAAFNLVKEFIWKK